MRRWREASIEEANGPMRRRIGAATFLRRRIKGGPLVCFDSVVSVISVSKENA